MISAASIVSDGFKTGIVSYSLKARNVSEAELAAVDMHAAEFRTAAKLRKHLAGVEKAVGIEGALQALLEQKGWNIEAIDLSVLGHSLGGAAALQFVRKVSGFNKPSKANEASFQAAVEQIAEISTRLLRSLETGAAPRNREEETAKAKARAAIRFGD